MSASPLSFLRAGPPPPKVVLLSDALFFSRSVPIAAGATPAEAATQIELALEAISPFPLAQLYHGSYWVPGSEHAFVYASYRRRFTTEQTAGWAEAEVVMPASAALFGGPVQPATTLILGSAEGITAVHWDAAPVPAKVVFRPVNPEASEEDRTRAREELLRSLGGSRAIVDLLVPPAADPAQSDREIVFRSGDFISRLQRPLLTSMDIRDRGDLAELRASRKRDLLLWRIAVGCGAALLLMLLAELALVGGRAWQKVRVAQVNSRAPTVQKIKEAQELAISIQDLVTKRFLPLEMVTSVLGTNADRKPGDLMVRHIQSRATPGSRGSFALVLEVETTNPAQVPVFRTELLKLGEIERVDSEPLPSQNNRSLFRLTVTFKPGGLKPEAT